MDATEERFRRLARSSPWRWRTLRFTVRYTGFGEGPMDEPVRGWIRRPDGIRVETLDGAVRRCERQAAPAAAYLTADGRGAPVPPDQPPLLDADGLVVSREDRPGHQDPMYDTYRWVAMLDPAELADGVAITDVHPVDHHGRAAWEAVLRPMGSDSATAPAALADRSPGEGYVPRCACCPLLHSVASAAIDAEERGSVATPPLGGYAEAHRVRLDVGTGVCVLTEEVGGPNPGRGHDVAVEAVDEELPDALFRPDRSWSPWRWRRLGR